MRFKNNIYKFIDVKKDYKTIILLVTLTLIEGCVPCVASVLVGRSIGVLSNAAEGHYATKHAMFHDLTMKTMSLMIVAAGSFPVCWINIYSWMQFGEKQGLNIRNIIIGKYLTKPMSWYDSQENLLGSFTQTNRCVEELRSSAAESSGITFQNVVTCCGLIGVSFYYSWSLTLIFLCSSPLIILSCILCSLKMEFYTDLENDESKKASDGLLWCLENIKIIKGFQTESKEFSHFHNWVKNCNTFFIKSAVYISANESIVRILSLVMFVQGFWFGNNRIKHGKLSTTQVMVCFSSCITLAATLMSTLQQIIFMQKGKVALKYINTMYDDNDKRQTVNDRLVQKNYPIFEDFHIELDNITFSYQSRPQDLVLQNISMNFKAHEISYIIGKSGSGKSTVSNLILKLYDDYHGSIKINGLNIKNVEDQWIYHNITLIEQNCTLFTDSIRNNITMGSNIANISEKTVIMACQIAQLNDFINSLPQGLDTVIGKNNKHGLQLSGGQQQRVTIARAIISNKPVWIMDEALSALDTAHKNLILSELKAFRKGKTTVMLTHDLSQIDDSSYIYYMDCGLIKEEGTRGTLMKQQNSIFRKLHNLQQNMQIECKTPVDDDVTFPIHELISSSRTTDTFHPTSNNATNSNTSSIPESSIWIKIRNLLIKTKKKQDGVEIQTVFSKSDCISLCFKNENENERIDDKTALVDRIPLMPLRKVIKSMNATIKHKKLLAIGLICSVLAGASNPVFSWSFSKLLNQSVPKEGSKNNSNSYLIKWSVIVISIAIADGFLTLVKSFLLKYVAEFWIYNLRLVSFDKILKQDMTWFQDSLNKPSEVAALVINDLRDLRTLVSEFISVVTTMVFVLLIGLIWALATGWKLSLVCLSLIPLYLIFSMIYGVLLQKAENHYKSCIADLENKQYEMVSNIKTIRLLQLEKSFLSQLDDLSALLKKAIVFRAWSTGFGVALFKTITFAVQAILLYYGLRLVCIGNYTVEKMFETFTLLLFTVVTCSTLSNSIPDMARGQRAASYIFEVINSQIYYNHDQIASIQPCSKPVSNHNNNNTIINFHSLTFNYPNSTTTSILDNLSFSVQKNEIIGLVGKSGCGKSTVANVLTLMYPINKMNSVLFNGRDINCYAESEIRKSIKVVEQKAVFFKGSVKENLTYGLDSRVIREDNIWTILKKLGMYNFVKNLPQGIDTLMDGSLVSGGQAQRLSLVRSLLCKPHVLILDECTSALDASNADIIENFVTSKSDESLKTTTRIIITHSKNMMLKCDRLIVLEDGAVVGSGSYHELIKKNVFFNELINNTI